MALKKKRIYAPDVSLIRLDGRLLVEKTYRDKAWPVRIVGILLVSWEAFVYSRLKDISGIPILTDRPDKLTLITSYMGGENLRSTRRKPDATYFEKLSRIIEQMHQRGVVHLDLRNRRNYGLDDSGLPYLVDFASCLYVPWPGRLKEFLAKIDWMGFLKVREKLNPEGISSEERSKLVLGKILSNIWLPGRATKSIRDMIRYLRKSFFRVCMMTTGSLKSTKEGSMLDGVVNLVHDIFNKKAVRSVLLKLRYPIFLVLFIILIPQIKPSWFLPGFIMSLLGELIQLWCFASLDKNKVLGVKGLYMFTRNPMYIGRFFLLLGCLILTGNIWVILIFTVLYYFYMVNRVKREEAKLRVVFGEAYEDYCRHVNQFVPSFKGVDWKSLWFFKWNLLLENNGHWNLIAVLVCYIVFYLFAFIYPS